MTHEAIILCFLNVFPFSLSVTKTSYIFLISNFNRVLNLVFIGPCINIIVEE